MYLHALATDYDGTIAENDRVPASTIAALERLKQSGRKLILVTGRELADLKSVFDRLDLFDLAVVENGALLVTPASGEERLLAPVPPPRFAERLMERGVAPLSVGRSIVATWEPHQAAVLETIRELGLELEIIFNKGAVMVLPSGVNKATGLAAALEALQLSAHNVVGVGDAENDHAFLRACGCSAAVANALAAVKETADFVTRRPRGAGVEELIDEIIRDDERLGALPRNRIAVGEDEAGVPVTLRPTDIVLIAGSSGIGKSTLATALTERMVEKELQFVVFDPEGDHLELEGAVAVGEEQAPPTQKQIFDLLGDPAQSVVVNALGLEVGERPAFFAQVFPEIAKLRARTGRPHWLLIDEAHHLMPKARDAGLMALPEGWGGALLITVHPGEMSADVLRRVDKILALGPADEVVRNFCEAIEEPPPEGLEAPGDDRVLYWNRAAGAAARLIAAQKPEQQHKRHIRKYAEGQLDEQHTFWFRGPEGALSLRAQNLMMFLQMAEGVDDATWTYHLERGDYSRWFAQSIRDDKLAEEAAGIEENRALNPADSRKAIAEAVRRRYTAPARAA